MDGGDVFDFRVGRPDVWPVDDLGLQMGAASLVGHSEKKLAPKKVMELGERFRPWRSAATWYLWRGAPWVVAG